MSETLVVVSKAKAYIREKSEMNTAASAIEALTKIVQDACDRAIENAKKDGRKTVMDRDFTASSV
ncbi:MAG: hypothetical protein JSR76_00470 [Verrucomicrobia bacterium]|jgi:histone H3/H4|nr:hypothetical protein [Verrucomicrobiota bacterium]